VSQENEDKADTAEARTRQTRGFMQQVRIASRRKYTPEEKVCIVLARVPRKKQDEIRKALHHIFYAA